MDVQLQELIDKIKKDGIASAEQSAAEIIEQAEKKSNKIIEEAQKKAEQIIKDSKSETQRMQKASEEAITQAGRNMLLSFRDSIVGEVDKLINANTEKAMSKDMLSKIIPDVIKAWAKDTNASELSVLLNEKDLKDLSNAFTNELKSEIKDGLEIKPDKTVNAGFRIGVKNGAAFYDFSAESLAQMFCAYLNPKISSLMKEAAKGL